MKNLLAMIMVLGLCSCAHRVKVMDVAAVSMTHSSIASTEKLLVTGPVKSEFCADSFKDKGDIGLFDESVTRAQTQYQIDYILGASFWMSGPCISVEGDGAKIVKNGK